MSRLQDIECQRLNKKLDIFGNVLIDLWSKTNISLVLCRVNLKF